MSVGSLYHRMVFGKYGMLEIRYFDSTNIYTFFIQWEKDLISHTVTGKFIQDCSSVELKNHIFDALNKQLLKFPLPNKDDWV